MEEEERFRRVAKSLAGNEKHSRVKALELVELWLTAHVSQAEYVELSKLCRALFYAIWLSDEATTTEKITKQVARFIEIGKSKYLKALLECVGTLWPKLDIYRLDKFYDLITCCLDELVIIGDQHNWDEQTMNQLFGVVEEQFTQHWRHTSKGLCLHVLDKYYEHVIRRILSFPSSWNKVELLWSLFHICVDDATQTDTLLVTRAKERIFSPLIEDCKAAATEQRYELLFLIRDWIPKLYQWAGSPERPPKSRKSLYALYNKLESTVSCLEDRLPQQVENHSSPPRRRSERLKNRLQLTTRPAEPQVVKQVRFSLDKNEEYVLPAMKKRRTQRVPLSYNK
ncbi:uncharacterized protein Gasu_58370 [Galdieria sulphuraria]|uniref:Uncharacterized protein n=1 Tax=Galdieria sulphuraria TaxID=130081 RepID=M2X9J5_GALSU|nr:uncharacterized protein Gasu_58370 [Galdieria sulphuraria]EME26512.1 hypothetical protein Gasu_58370 [Galdieria sulphuraria]|eukprot:XP_005703032.1 hypothetical protein Gasu_58370 [Galdieria sulphuraria]